MTKKGLSGNLKKIKISEKNQTMVIPVEFTNSTTFTAIEKVIIPLLTSFSDINFPEYAVSYFQLLKNVVQEKSEIYLVELEINSNSVSDLDKNLWPEGTTEIRLVTDAIKMDIFSEEDSSQALQESDQEYFERVYGAKKKRMDFLMGKISELKKVGRINWQKSFEIAKQIALIGTLRDLTVTYQEDIKNIRYNINLTNEDRKAQIKKLTIHTAATIKLARENLNKG